MDIGNAVLLGAMVLGLVALMKKLIYGTKEERIVVGVVFIAALISVFLLRQSVWASEQIVDGHKLSELDAWSCVVVVVMIASLASSGWEGLTALKNIGQNQVKAPNLSGIDGPKVK